MIRTLLATAAIGALTVAASAADLPGRSAAVAPAPMFTVLNWTGFYVGAQIGYASERVTGTNATAALLLPDPGTTTPAGVVGGLHAGYNYQTGALVLGIEGDIEATGLSKSTLTSSLTRFHTAKADWQGSIRGRVGYAFDRALIYATGGVAFQELKESIGNVGAAPYHSFSNQRAGWTLGGGLEYAVTNNWSVRAEYRYTDFGKSTNIGGINSGNISNARENAFRLGLSYKFGGPSAVVAKY